MRVSRSPGPQAAASSYSGEGSTVRANADHDHAEFRHADACDRSRETGGVNAPQYGRLVHEWIAAVGLNSEDYGTHSLWRTKATIFDKQTDSPRSVQTLLGHSPIEGPLRYLDVDVEDALALSEAVDISEGRTNSGTLT